MAQTSFLFRIDGARENDDFMTMRGKRHGSRLYSGASMKVGPGWVPDFLEVTTDGDANSVHLTLIELWATENETRISCRKYLPESSIAILDAFSRYLDSVVAKCLRTADPRLEALKQLRDFLAASDTVVVRTAGALRASADFLEVFPLLDQPEGFALSPASQRAPRQPTLLFEGHRPFSRDEVDGLLRVVHVLHSVVVGKDHGGGKLKGWRNVQRKVLVKVLSLEPDRYPELSRLTSSYAMSGARVDCDRVSSELANLWTGAGRESTSEQVRSWIKAFHPIVVAFPAHELMRNVFEQARKVVAVLP